MNKRQQLIDEAHTWLRTPYHHLGNVKGVGVDCAMLLCEVYKAVGLAPQDLDPRPYAPQWHLHKDEEAFLGWIKDFGTLVNIPLAGDVVLWKFGRAYSHGGIVIDDQGGIIHAYQEAGIVTLGNCSEGILAARASKFFRIKGIEL
jgi:cell wall-associated NlpC family hydrolase